MQKQKSRISFIILPIILLLAIVCAFSLRASASTTAHASEITGLSGDGTENSPKHINNPEEFMFFMDKVNNGSQEDEAYLSYYYTLDKNIDLKEILRNSDFSAIGTETRPFNGSFNGKGYIISNLTLSTTSTNAGLFGYLGENAVVKNVGVVESRIESENNNVGGLAGVNNGKIENSFYHGIVRGGLNVGGIVGVNKGEISYSFANGSITASLGYVGGLVGRNENKLHYSYSLSTINCSNNNTTFIGGVIGARTNELATPLYTFYNLSTNVELNAIGYSSKDADNAYDKSVVSLGQDRVRGLTRKEYSTLDALSVFGRVGNVNWARSFNASNHSAYFAFVQSTFANRIESESKLWLNNLETACAERMYGFDSSSEEAWGTQENPYLISDKQHLLNLQNAVTNEGETYYNNYFKQTANVDFSVGGTRTRIYPIGSYGQNSPFQGNYNGENNKIVGFNIDVTATESAYLGLFGYTGDSAVISNLILDDCFVGGVENVGSLIGYSNDSTVVNVETFATVEAQSNGGGVIGFARNGNYSNVLSQATLQSRGTVTNTLYGVIGSVQGSCTFNRVWYFAEFDAKYNATNKWGNVLLVDDRNGSVSATKSSDGTISFVSTSSTAGYSVEYRKDDESVVETNATYVPLQSTTSTEVVYARFVKEINVYMNDSSLASVSIRGESYKLYDGQSFMIAISIKEGAYVSNVVYKNSNDETYASDEGTYNYEGNTASVLYSDVMDGNIKDVVVNAEKITWGSDVFPTLYTYNGESVSFPVEALDKPDGFNVLVVYSSIIEPVEANQNDSENYSLTLIYQNSGNVRMGSINTSFHINKAQLTVDKNALGNKKEWDNSMSPAVTTVDQNGVGGKVVGDDVVVSATMTFNSTAITTTASVTYEFSITGNDARNYIVPQSVTYENFGTITKRKILINFDSYESVFAGVGKNPSINGKKITSKGVIASQPYEAVYEFEHKYGGEHGSVGEYTLKVSLSNTYMSAIDYYDIYFEKSAGDDSEYTVNDTVVEYLVKPLEVSVVYLINGKETDSVVYNGSSHVASGYFLNEKGAKVSLSISSNPSDIVGAGEYALSISGFSDDNYKLLNESKTISVNKATQNDLTILSSLNHIFGSVYVASVEGGSGDGVINYSVAEGSEDFAQFDGANLTILKAGTIGLTAIKAESENYLSQSVSWNLEVQKADLTIKIENTTINYLDEIIWSFTSDGVIPSGVDGVVVSIDGNVYSGEILDCGEYQISIDVSGALSDGYNLIAGDCGVLTVNKLAITVSADDVSSVYGEPIKELTYSVSDSRVTALEGSLATTANDAGEYPITINDLAEKNLNYDVNFVEGIYTVAKKQLVVKVQEQTKQYGQPDPVPTYEVDGLVKGDSIESIGLDVSLYREKGEESYMEENGLNYTYKYFKNSITHQSNNYEKEVEFVFNSLVILPGEPIISSIEDVTIVAGTSLLENGNPNAVVKGKVYDKENGTWSDSELAGTFAWKSDAVPDFREVGTLTFVAVFTPNDKNFLSVEFDVDVSVQPVEITLKVLSDLEITYDGYNHNKLNYELVGLLDGDDAMDSVTYTGDYKNVGTFKATVNVANCNYVLKKGTVTFEIVKAELTISVEDVVVLEGEEATIKYMYFGLQSGDTEDILTRQPSVTLPKDPGTYTLTPAGASAKNYKLKFESFEYKVLRKETTNENGDVLIKGQFDADMTFELVETKDYGDISSLYGAVQSSYANLKGKEIEKVFQLDYKLGEETAVVEGKTYLTMLKPTGYEDSAVAYVLYTNNGELIYVQDLLYDGDHVTIDVTNAKAVVFLAEKEDNSMTLYIVIAGVAVLVIIIAVVVVKVRKRKESRYIKYND